MLKRRSDGKLVTNKFWFEQGSIKALRNAKSRLIPDDIKAKVLAYAKSKGKVKEVLPPVSQKSAEETKPAIKKKPLPSTSPKVIEEPFFPDDKEKGPGFSPEEKEVTAEMPTQKEILDLTRLEATLVDKYRFTPDQIIEKLEKKYGEANLSKLTREQTNDAREYFEETIEYLEKNARK